MSMLQWILLCGIFTIYLLLGGLIFMAFEQEVELENKEHLSLLRRDIKEILLRLDHELLINGTTPETLRADRESVVQRISERCDSRLWDNTIPDTLQWDFYNSVMYGFTIVTTIGYGHLTPKSDWSRLMAIIFGLIGIPINGILLKTLGDFFGDKMMKVYEKSKNNNWLMIFKITMYLLPGLVIFLFLPAALFAYVEKWTFIESLYFASISLMTIGFGDFVPGKANGDDVWLWVYKAFIIIWIQFGLGYVFMILSFITKGLKHKRIRRALQKRMRVMSRTKEQLLEDLEDMRRVIGPSYKSDQIDKNDGSFYYQNVTPNSSRSSFNHSDHECSQSRRSFSETNLIEMYKNVEYNQTNVMSNDLLNAVVNVVEDVLEAVEEMSEFEPTGRGNCNRITSKYDSRTLCDNGTILEPSRMRNDSTMKRIKSMDRKLRKNSAPTSHRITSTDYAVNSRCSASTRIVPGQTSRAHGPFFRSRTKSESCIDHHHRVSHGSQQFAEFSVELNRIIERFKNIFDADKNDVQVNHHHQSSPIV